MSVYRTEEEQIEAIKKWWNKYSNIITVCLLALLVSTAGYRYWDWHNKKVLAQASTAYENLIIAYANHQDDSVKSYSTELFQNYQSTVYAQVAHLVMAKVYLNEEKPELAEQELSLAAQSQALPALQQVAKIRLSRMYASKKNYDKAMAELSSIKETTYQALIEELKGDIYASQGKIDEANSAYQQASEEVRMNGLGNQFLEMKINELASFTQSKTGDQNKVKLT